MKPAQIFRQYIWIINTLRTCGRLTLEQLNHRWVEDRVAEGNALQRSSFNRHRDAILDMFGIIIACDQKTYEYYISNPQELNDDSVGRWMYSTLTVHGVLADSAAVRERVVLENVPAGEEFLQTIIQAVKQNRCLRIGYRKFEAEGYERTVCPYALKLFHQRWYLLARLSAEDCPQGGSAEELMRIYALDRMTTVKLTEKVFEMPEDFSAQAYFSEYFGVLTDRTPMAHVLVRAHKWMPNYLRTLPLHHSQRELESTADYTDFSYDIRPTSDFLGELLRHGDGIEVLAPPDLRQKMRQIISENLKRYGNREGQDKM